MFWIAALVLAGGLILYVMQGVGFLTTEVNALFEIAADSGALMEGFDFDTVDAALEGKLDLVPQSVE